MKADANLTRIGTDGANAIYPAATEEELGDLDRLVTNYRRALGRQRLMLAAMGLGVVAYIVDYVRRPSAPRG